MESLIPKGVDAISIKKIDDYTYEATTQQKGNLLPDNVISKGGKTWTSTTTGKNAQGQTVNHVVVWEKQ